MDNRSLKLAESIENNDLGLDDTFQFQCKACGKCCKNRHDIMLTTRDLYNIAKLLGRTVPYIVERYCDIYIGETSRLPIVRLLPNGPEQVCPFFLNKRCTVHNAKPVVCALYPLGRGVKKAKADNGDDQPEKVHPIYFFHPVSCGSKDQTHTVCSWLGQFNIPVEDDFYTFWTEAVIILSDFFHILEDNNAPDSIKKPLWDLVFSAMYICYDVEKDLMSQFHDNMMKLLNIFTGIEKLTGGQ